MQSTLAPILLFVFNRPDHTRQTIDALRRNTLAAQSHLFIYSDAPRNEKDAESVNEVRRMIATVEGFKEVTIIARDENRGLARNIIDGVTTQVNKYGKVIVLEDDLITSPHFLTFMNDALDTYHDETRVGHIYACDYTQEPSLPDTYLIRFTGSWGWATWDRAWKLFNPDGKALLQEMERRQLTHTFDFDGTYPYTRMLRRQVNGEINSWIITESRYKTFRIKKSQAPQFKEAVEESRYKQEQSNRFVRLVYRALASEIISISKASVLLNTPINAVRNQLNLV